MDQTYQKWPSYLWSSNNSTRSESTTTSGSSFSGLRILWKRPSDQTESPRDIHRTLQHEMGDGGRNSTIRFSEEERRLLSPDIFRSQDLDTRSPRFEPLLQAVEENESSSMAARISNSEKMVNTGSFGKMRRVSEILLPPQRVKSDKKITYSFNLARVRREDQDFDDKVDASRGGSGFFTRFVIIPELPEDLKARGHFHHVEVWDLCITILVFFTAYLVPFEAVVLTETSVSMLFFNQIITLIFTMDLVLQFFVAYSNPSADMSHDLWETDLRKIAVLYAGPPYPIGEFGVGWFWVDLISTAPGWIHLYVRLFAGTTKITWQLKILKMARVIKLYRMLNLPRLARFFKRWHAMIGFSYHLVDLLRFIVVTTLAAHWFACLWLAIEGKVLTADISYHTDRNSWLSVLIDTKGDPCDPSAAEDPVCVYMLGLYWSTMTLTTVGYGDIAPQNLPEYAVCTLAMLLSGFVWAYVVGAVVTLIQSMDSGYEKFKRDMDSLTEMMESRNLPQELQVRMRRYMHESQVAQRQLEQDQLLRNTISDGLQREVARCSARTELLQGIYWAEDFDEEPKMELVKAFRPLFFGPKEVIMLHQCVLVVQRGLLAVRGQIIRRGDVWGIECILLESEDLLESAQPRTLSYACVMCLERDDLLEIARQFPAVDEILRKAQIRVAVRRALFLGATKLKAMQAKRTKEGRRLSRQPSLIDELEEAGILSRRLSPDSSRRTIYVQKSCTQTFSGEMFASEDNHGGVSTSSEAYRGAGTGSRVLRRNSQRILSTARTLDTLAAHQASRRSSSPPEQDFVDQVTPEDLLRMEARLMQKQELILHQIYKFNKSVGPR